MRILLLGLWARRGLNAAALLVTVAAVAAAVLGPMYARAAAEHLLDTRIGALPLYTTGLTGSWPALQQGSLPLGDPDKYHAPQVSTLVQNAADNVDGPGVERFWRAQTPWALDDGGSLTYQQTTFTVPLYWRKGMCDLAQVQGRCPTRPGDVLMQATMADTLGLGRGDTVTLDYVDHYSTMIKGVGGQQFEDKSRDRQVSFRLVGTYRIAHPDSPAWFDSTRFTGFDNLHAAPGGLGASGDSSAPPAPALLVAPSSMTSQSFVGGVDRPIDLTAVNLDDVPAVQRAALEYTQRAAGVGAGDSASFFDLATPLQQVRAEHTLLTRVLIAALAPFVVLSLLLLFALVSAAAAVRRPYVSLAKLRGHSGAQVLRFAVAEPVALVVVATPVALVLGDLAAHLAARLWLHGDIPGGGPAGVVPVRVDTATIVAAAVVVGASLVAAGAAAMSVIREPLAASLASAVRPDRQSSRSGLMLRSAVVAVALAAVVQLLTSTHQANQLLALLAPVFIALAVAVIGALLLRWASRWWVRRTAERGGTAGYLASRRLGRRRDLANLMVPLLLAVSVVTFALSASAVSDDWRVSRADAQVGGAVSYEAFAPPGVMMHLARRLDPQGRYLTVATVDNSGDEMGRTVFVDTTRLRAAVAWDPAWSDLPLSQLQRKLAPPTHRLAFTGSHLSVQLRDISLKSVADNVRELWLQYVADNGLQSNVLLGRVRNGDSQTLRAFAPHCRHKCLVEQLYLSGEGQSVTDSQGRFTIAGVRVDGAPVDWRLGKPDGWRAAHPFAASLVDPPVQVVPGPQGLGVHVYLQELPGAAAHDLSMLAGYARITPGGTPEVQPVLATDGTKPGRLPPAGSNLAEQFGPDVVVGTALNGQDMPVRVVARVKALPLVGSVGELGDLETNLVEYDPPAGSVTSVQLWAAPGTPGALLDKVRAQGISLSPRGQVATTLAQLRGDAFSLGLRLLLIVGLATLVLAVFGVFASAVLQSRWRSYEVAALRVVGVSQRSLVRGSVLEYVVMLGLAVVLGLVSAYVSLRLVLPSISLGLAPDFSPKPIYAVHWPIVAGVGVVLFLVATLIALLVSRRITRLGRPSTLRWAEQS
ncbi:MAG TPA: ABC transporter permease [Nocardioidaceae bacterium]|nr:ABC transporter permease [Nocardioidaceae bacterium]